MTLRRKLIGCFVGLHVALAAAAVVILIERPGLLFLIEASFLLSVVICIRLVRALFVPLDLIRTGADLISERDFTSRFVAVGQAEMDTLIDVYNRMLDRLREERLSAEEQSQLLQKIMDASPAGVVICDFDGKPVRLNPAAVALLSIDRNDDGVPGAQSAALWPAIAAIPVGDSRMVVDAEGRRLRVSRTEFRDRGFPKTFFLIEELTEELRRSEKAAYDKLIRIMSHEVNNSVGAVRSLLESSLVYAPQVGEADREDFVGALTISSARMDSLNQFMSGFADVLRIPAPRLRPASPAAVVERVSGLLRPEFRDRSIELDLRLEDRGDYSIDESQIEQVVLNVFRNALDAVGREGRVDASFMEGELVVRDSGPGIAASVESQLFTPFFTTRRDGRGLGLTIVQEIVANHGLRCTLRNRAEGGAEFRMTFGGTA